MTPIYVSGKGGSNYTPHPAGQFPARCIDVVDMGWHETDYGPKYKVRIAFYCGLEVGRDKDGEQYTYPSTVMAFFTASLHEKAKLREFVESWRGRPFTAEEVEKFDLEKLLGAPAFVQIVHGESGGKVYANIKSIMQLPKGMTAPAIPPDYVRVCNRPEWEGPAPHPEMSKPVEPQPKLKVDDDDDGLPF
jgi:hypothetical protein